MKRSSVSFLLLLVLAPARRAAAAEIAAYFLPNNRVEYEGLGYREFEEGWDIKLKPSGVGAGVVWRAYPAERWMVQAQYWRNQPYYAREDGNAKSATQRQTGQTKLSVHNFLADAGRPLSGSRVWAVAGLQAAHQQLRRRDIVFNGAAEPGESRENITALGAYLGFRGGSRPERRFYAEWEFLLGHFFHTYNTETSYGGSIRREGYSNALRLETGYRSGRWRAGLGWVRQLLQVHVPGGKTFPSGAAKSFPINKTDFISPFLTVAYEY